MDTRDQTLTKLTWLHGKSHPTHHCPASLRWITHARRWASWNWSWRMVDDDDGNGFPSPEPRTNSRSALPRKIRAWRRLRIVKHDESFSPIFSPWTWIYRVGVEVGGAPGAHEAGGAPPPSWTGCGPLVLILSPVFFINSKNLLRGFSGHSENFYFCTKITPWQFCWKQRQSGLVPFKSCKLESKTRAKVFGKVDTMETYQLPKLKPLLVLKQFSWQTESDKEKLLQTLFDLVVANMWSQYSSFPLKRKGWCSKVA